MKISVSLLVFSMVAAMASGVTTFCPKAKPNDFFMEIVNAPAVTRYTVYGHCRKEMGDCVILCPNWKYRRKVIPCVSSQTVPLVRFKMPTWF